MTAIKSYTDIEQSRKLAEILPLETADMVYIWHTTSDNPTWRFDGAPMVLYNVSINEISAEVLPCWSLTTLIERAKQLCTRFEITVRADKKFNIFATKHDFRYLSWEENPEGIDNLVDALCELIPRLPAEGEI